MGQGLVLTATAVAIVSMFLVWVDLGFDTESELRPKSLVLLVPFAWPVYAALQRRNSRFPTIVLALVAFSLAVVLHVDEFWAMEVWPNPYEIISTGPGVWVFLAATLLLLWGGVLNSGKASGRDSFAQGPEPAGDDVMEFLDAVVHDLKTPLITLDWLTKDMEYEIKDANRESLEGTVGRIRSSVEGMDRLVADLLAISRLERGEEDRGAIALVPLINEVVADHEDSAVRKSARITVEARAAPVIHADPARIRQVLTNLISNALKYGKDQGGRILILLEVRTKSHKPDHVRLEVWDDGPGVPPAQRSRIFRMFERNAEEARAVGGTGLGLALVSKVADHYGGKAWVIDAPAGGARFIVTLDATQVQPISFQPKKKVQVRGPTTVPAQPSVQNTESALEPASDGPMEIDAPDVAEQGVPADPRPSGSRG